VKEPAVANTLLNLLPGAMLPLLKLLSSAVTVWVMASLFVQVMVVPAETVMVDGLKLMFTMETALPEEPGGGLLFEEL